MSSPNSPRPISAIRIITLVLSIIFTGNLIAAVICYLQPKIYESTGSFTEWAAPDQSTQLAGAHAATAVSALSLHLRWSIPFDDAVQRLKDSVAIETTASETVIRAQLSSAQDARLIVETLMKNFPGFERERQWAQIEGIDGRYTEKEEQTERLVRQLKQAMVLTLKEADHNIPGSLVSAATVERLGNEDLRRQFQLYQKLNEPKGRFGPADGSILIPPPIAEEPTELQSAISPNIDAYLIVGRVSGLVVAIATLLIIFFRKPSLLEIPPPKPDKTPAWAEMAENGTRDRLSW